MATGNFYVLGQKPAIKAGLHSTNLLDELINYLIANTYSKLPYLKYRTLDPIAEIKAVLTADDVAQHSLDINSEELNPLALNELRQYLFTGGIPKPRIAVRYCRPFYRYSLGLETGLGNCVAGCQALYGRRD